MCPVCNKNLPEVERGSIDYRRCHAPQVRSKAPMWLLPLLVAVCLGLSWVVAGQVPYSTRSPLLQFNTFALAFAALIMLPLNFMKMGTRQKIIATLFGLALVFIPLWVNDGLASGKQYASPMEALEVIVRFVEPYMWIPIAASPWIVVIVVGTLWRRVDARERKPLGLLEQDEAPSLLPWGL